MPTPNLPVIGDNPSMQQITDYLVKLQRDHEWLLQNLDDMNVRRLRADVLVAGTLDAGKVTIRSNLTSGFVQIDGNGMRINNGAFDTFTANSYGQVTMTRALIQSNPGGYPRIVMDPNNELFGAYQTAANFALLKPNGSVTNSPALQINQGSAELNVGFGLQSLANVGIFSSESFEIRTPGQLYLSSSLVGLTSWSNLRNLNTNQTLEQALQSKLSGNGAYGGFYAASSPGGPADMWISITNGLISP